MLKVCPKCKESFSTSIGKRVFCSVKCSVSFRSADEAYLTKLRKPKQNLERKDYACNHCGASFTSTVERKYCSSKCGNQDRLLGKGYLVPIECKECKKMFKPIRSSLKYCSVVCASVGKAKDPTFIDRLKVGCAKRSSDQGYIQKLSESAKKRWESPDFRKKMEDIFDSEEWLLKSTDNYSSKEYVFPSGRTEKIQGYEDKALDDLLKTYEEDDIVVNKSEIRRLIGPIFYRDRDNVKRRYVPDVYVKSSDLIVEAKSDWTYRVNQEVNELKKEACLRLGHRFSFMIY